MSRFFKPRTPSSGPMTSFSGLRGQPSYAPPLSPSSFLFPPLRFFVSLFLGVISGGVRSAWPPSLSRSFFLGNILKCVRVLRFSFCLPAFCSPSRGVVFGRLALCLQGRTVTLLPFLKELSSSHQRSDRGFFLESPRKLTGPVLHRLSSLVQPLSFRA